MKAIGRLLSVVVHAFLLVSLIAFASAGEMKWAGGVAILAGAWNVFVLYMATGWKEMYFEAMDKIPPEDLFCDDESGEEDDGQS